MRPIPLAVLALVSVLAGCDSEGAGSTDDVTTHEVELAPLNNSGVTGSALVTLDEGTGELTFTLEAQGLDGAVHPVYLRGAPGGDPDANAVCPTLRDDAGGDGLIDIIEGLPVFGGVLLPLDDDLSTQVENRTAFSTGPSLSYERSTTLEELADLLGRPDSNPGDQVFTLGPGVEVELENYVFVVHGTSETLDPTVRTYPGQPAQETFPVACGEIDAPRR